MPSHSGGSVTPSGRGAVVVGVAVVDVGTVVGLEGGAAVLVVVVVLVLLVVSAAVVDVVEGASVVGPEVAGDGTAGVVAGGDETDVQAARKANRTIGRRTGPRLAAVAG